MVFIRSAFSAPITLYLVFVLQWNQKIVKDREIGHWHWYSFEREKAKLWRIVAYRVELLWKSLDICHTWKERTSFQTQSHKNNTGTQTSWRWRCGAEVTRAIEIKISIDFCAPARTSARHSPAWRQAAATAYIWDDNNRWFSLQTKTNCCSSNSETSRILLHRAETWPAWKCE